MTALSPASLPEAHAGVGVMRDSYTGAAGVFVPRGNAFPSPEPFRRRLPPGKLVGALPVVRPPSSSAESVRDRREAERDRQSSTGDLAEFLRNTTPPPDNFMSIPDDYSFGRPEDAAKLAPLIHFFRRRSKSTSALPKLPPRIRLPDSAVAGTTIGGHRHIAISIPLEYTYFDPPPSLSKPHFPPYNPYGTPRDLGSGPIGPVKTFTNERGVVTVLRTVAEEQESLSSSSAEMLSVRTALSPPPPPSRGSGRGRGPPVSLHYSPHTGLMQRGDSLQGQPPTSLPPLQRLTPREDEAAQFTDFSSVGSVPMQRSQPYADISRSLPSSGKPVVPAAKVRYPSRRSSARAGMAQELPHNLDSMVVGGFGGHQRGISGDSQQGSRASYYSAYSAADPGLLSGLDLAMPARAPPIPGDFASGPPGGESSRSIAIPPLPELEMTLPDAPKITVISESPVVMGGEIRRPKSSKSDREARQERVRERKQRDMLISQARRGKLRDDGLSLVGDVSPIPSNTPSMVSAVEHLSDRSTTDQPTRPSSTAGEHPALSSAIMVVANIQPSTPRAISPAKAALVAAAAAAVAGTSAPKPLATPPPQGDIPVKTSSPVSTRTVSQVAVYTASSSGPTPPDSPRSGSPPSKPAHLPPDRTSLSRRREWNAERERERRAREAARLALGKDAVPGVNMTKRDLLKKVDALRELRIREMERRLTRLERNGDVWLRALVPVLDNLNRTLIRIREEDGFAPRGSGTGGRQRPRTWLSDSEDDDSGSFGGKTWGAAQRRGRSLGSPRDYRRRTPLQSRFFVELARRRELLLREQQLSAQLAALGSSGSEAGAEEEAEAADLVAELANDLAAEEVTRRSDSESGLETLEPLMRELQGATRLSMESRGGRAGERSDDERL